MRKNSFDLNCNKKIGFSNLQNSVLRITQRLEIQIPVYLSCIIQSPNLKKVFVSSLAWILYSTIFILFPDTDIQTPFFPAFCINWLTDWQTDRLTDCCQFDTFLWKGCQDHGIICPSPILHYLVLSSHNDLQLQSSPSQLNITEWCSNSFRSRILTY